MKISYDLPIWITELLNMTEEVELHEVINQ